jgi:hypothetical protein
MGEPFLQPRIYAQYRYAPSPDGFINPQGRRYFLGNCHKRRAIQSIFHIGLHPDITDQILYAIENYDDSGGLAGMVLENR